MTHCLVSMSVTVLHADAARLWRHVGAQGSSPLLTLIGDFGGQLIDDIGNDCSRTATVAGGLPAARVGDMLVCVGPPDSIVKGSATVKIGGVPAARMGDSTAHGGQIMLGAFNVMIGG